MDRDRHLTDFVLSGNLHGAWGAAVLFIFVTVALMAGFPVPLAQHPVALYPLAVGLGFVGGRAVGLLVLGASGRTAQSVYLPTAAGTYAQQHSAIDALEAKGDLAGAVAAWEELAASEPGNPWPLIRAGELYFRRLREPLLALERFRRARDLPGINPEHRRYASLKIIDLHLGPLNDRGRALVELRRVVERWPGTREAQYARQAIANLKGGRSDNSG
jgi:hypothetical protein